MFISQSIKIHNTFLHFTLNDWNDLREDTRNTSWNILKKINIYLTKVRSYHYTITNGKCLRTHCIILKYILMTHFVNVKILVISHASASTNDYNYSVNTAFRGTWNLWCTNTRHSITFVYQNISFFKHRLQNINFEITFGH
jgi:hypothetical protein